MPNVPVWLIVRTVLVPLPVAIVGVLLLLGLLWSWKAALYMGGALLLWVGLMLLVFWREGVRFQQTAEERAEQGEAVPLEKLLQEAEEDSPADNH